MLREKFLGTELIKEAMRAKDKMRLQVVKNLKSNIMRQEGGKKEMTDAEIINLIKKSIEGLEETIEFYNKDTMDRTEAISEAKNEIEVLQSFMPQQMSEDEIDMAITEIINETGASAMSEMGKVMGMFAKQYAGKADNSIASKLIKSKLQ